MITYQVDDRTYFIPVDWYFNREHLSMNDFVKEIINSKFVHLDLEDSFDSKIEDDKVELNTFSKILSDEIDQEWLKENEVFE